MNVAAIINENLRGRVGLRKLYPYTLADIPYAGQAFIQTGEVILNSKIGAFSPSRIASIYLHETAHLIAADEGIDHDPNASMHNRFYACLLAVMYRRAGLLDMLKIYEFGDTIERQGAASKCQELPSDGELVRRFAYIIRRSAELAPLPLTVEQIARKIYREDVYPLWTKSLQNKAAGPRVNAREVVTWALGAVVGSIATAALAVSILR